MDQHIGLLRVLFGDDIFRCLKGLDDDIGNVGIKDPQYGPTDPEFYKMERSLAKGDLFLFFQLLLKGIKTLNSVIVRLQDIDRDDLRNAIAGQDVRRKRVQDPPIDNETA